MLKHSPWPPFRVAAGLLPAGRASVDLHRSGQCQGQPWAEPGPEEIALTAQVNQQGGAGGWPRYQARSGSLQPRARWPIGLV